MAGSGDEVSVSGAPSPEGDERLANRTEGSRDWLPADGGEATECDE